MRRLPYKWDIVEIQKWYAVLATYWSILFCNIDNGTRVRKWAVNKND